MIFPDISPIAFEIGPLAIRWYALSYVVGILLGYRYVCWLDNRNATPVFSQAARDDLILYAVLGVILGGRLGYSIFYNHAYYLEQPLELLKLWHGGMSFHGGLIGVLVAFALFARRHRIAWLRVMDYLATATPIGLCLGRLANFINGELYGRVTNASWGIVFPNGGDLPRYPSQLLQAALEGAALFVLLWLLATRSRALSYRGMVGGAFLAGYGVFRFCVEFFREPDAQLGLLWLQLSMGQWLCVPMILVGSGLMLSAKRRGV